MSNRLHWPRPLHVFFTACAVAIKDMGHGLLIVSHNTVALLGLVLVLLVTLFGSQPQLRHAVEHHALAWLTERRDARSVVDGALAPAEPGAAQRVSAIDVQLLPRAQAAVTHWLARRYKVAPEAVARIVQEAWALGAAARMAPTLILAIVAVESGFNPLAQSPVGAQGLMQVMTRVHDAKYEAFGGERAALDPLTNLRVGVQVLRDCVHRAGSVALGLRCYVGAANLDDDGGYAAKVLFEQEQLKAVSAGKPVPISRPPASGASQPDAPSAESIEPVAPAASAQQVALARL